MSSFDLLADLSLTVEFYRLEGLRRTVSRGFDRHTTVVRLGGLGAEGIGEDVTYEVGEQLAFQRHGTTLPLRGSFTLAEFSRLVGGLDLFSEPPDHETSRNYRRWAVESAALDLALYQAGKSLEGILDLTAKPVRFVVSMSLGQPPSTVPMRRLLSAYPSLRFKLDASSAWSQELVEELVELGVVDVIDLKGQYHGTIVDQPPDPVLYERVAEAFARVWIEDPALDAKTTAILAAHRDRVTWDAPIHHVDDIHALPFPPRTLNFKPSRFGTLKALFDAYDMCREHGIEIYGGGQFELGCGRGQIQYLAALFHPDAPNDVAPGGYNMAELAPDLPLSPLAAAPGKVGFRWSSPA